MLYDLRHGIIYTSGRGGAIELCINVLTRLREHRGPVVEPAKPALDNGGLGSLTAASARGRIGSVQLLGASRPRIFPGLRFALGSTPLNRARSIAKAGAEMSSSSQRACSVPTAWWCDKVAPQSTNCC